MKNFESLGMGLMETGMAWFDVTNTSDQPIKARAGYNVVPEQTGPYFQKLQRDWAGRATALLVQPYSLDITPEREAALRSHVAQSYGAGAQLELLPVLAYGSPLPDASAIAPMAQHSFAQQGVSAPGLIALLEQFDALLSDAASVS